MWAFPFLILYKAGKPQNFRCAHAQRGALPLSGLSPRSPRGRGASYRPSASFSHPYRQRDRYRQRQGAFAAYPRLSEAAVFHGPLDPGYRLKALRTDLWGIEEREKGSRRLAKRLLDAFGSDPPLEEGKGDRRAPFPISTQRAKRAINVVKQAIACFTPLRQQTPRGGCQQYVCVAHLFRA